MEKSCIFYFFLNHILSLQFAALYYLVLHLVFILEVQLYILDTCASSEVFLALVLNAHLSSCNAL